MDARRVGDFADDRIFIQIDNDNFRRVRKVETARSRIDRQNIPAAFASNRYLCYEVVRFVRRAPSRKSGQGNSQLCIEKSNALLNFALSEFLGQNSFDTF